MSIKITSKEFIIVQKLLFKSCGINLNDNRHNMVEARLNRRLEHYGVSSYADYLKIVQLSKVEKNEFLNALSTNETYFFREEAHFEFIQSLVSSSSKLRVWSAAASMGAEAYSIAMILASHLSQSSWEVVGSDLNTDVLDVAKNGLYPFSWASKIPQQYKSKYCLKGSGKFEGKVLIDRILSTNMNFFQHNLLESNITLGEFDVIFLRNVLLYFTEETKLKVITNLLNNLKIGGFLIISMTENFDDNQIKQLKFLKNNIYQRVQ
jgi:chemotaxis protein methyltransferase CheR